MSPSQIARQPAQYNQPPVPASQAPKVAVTAVATGPRTRAPKAIGGANLKAGTTPESTATRAAKAKMAVTTRVTKSVGAQIPGRPVPEKAPLETATLEAPPPEAARLETALPAITAPPAITGTRTLQIPINPNKS